LALVYTLVLVLVFKYLSLFGDISLLTRDHNLSLFIMLFSTLLFVNAASATCLHGLSMFKKRAESAEGGVEVGKFGYGPLNGPFNWATLAVENEACKAGANQSPINIGTFSTILSIHEHMS
jgi:carbonic anhydrase